MIPLFAGFCLACLAIQGLTVLPEWSVFPVLIACALILLAPVLRRRLEYVHILSLFTAGVLLGAWWTMMCAQQVMTQRLLPQWERRDMWIQGQVVEGPVSAGRGQRFTLRVDGMQTALSGIGSGSLVRLSTYHRGQAIKGGECWRVLVRLKRPHGLANEGTADPEARFLVKRISAAGYVRQSAINSRLVNGSCPGIRSTYVRWRFNMAGSVERATREMRYGPILMALTTGERSSFSDELWQVLRATGTAHLVAISGLHIGLVAALFFVSTRWLWSRSYRLTLYWSSMRAAVAPSLIGALAYSALAGFTLPTQRALLMTTVAMIALWLRLPVWSSVGLLFALVVVLLLDPFASLSAGLWLSFGAVGVIFYTMGARLALAGKLKALFVLQVSIALGLMPLTLAWFGSAPVSGPLANIVAVPVFSLLVVPIALAGVLFLQIWDPLGMLLLHAAHILLTAIMSFLNYLAGIESIQWQVSTPPLWATIIAMLGAMLILAPKGIPARWSGWILLAPLWFPLPHQAIPSGSWRLTVMDVGQGSAILVQTAQHQLLYDTGPGYPDGGNLVERVILPSMRELGAKKLDALIISHGDKDHAGGWPGINDHIEIDTVYVGGDLFDGNRRCHKGMQWQWDGVTFKFIHPLDDSGFKNKDDEDSCVLFITSAHGSALLPGDIRQRTEQVLLSSALLKRADVVLMPHHGSKHGSSDAMITRIQPRYALASSGYLNRYRFPHVDTVRRYREHGARILNTACDGSIWVDFQPNGINLYSYRERHPRYWHTGCQ